MMSLKNVVLGMGRKVSRMLSAHPTTEPPLDLILLLSLMWSHAGNCLIFSLIHDRKIHEGKGGKHRPGLGYKEVLRPLVQKGRRSR